MNKRVGANRLKTINEQRIRKSRRLKRMLPWYGVAVVVLLLGFAGYMYMPDIMESVSGKIEVYRILPADYKIEGCSRHTATLLSTVLDSLIGKDSLTFKRSNIVNAAQSLPSIEKVNVRKSFGKQTVVTVTERIPVAIIQKGVLSLVDSKGAVFPPEPGTSYDLPLLIGMEQNSLAFEIFAEIRRVSMQLGGSFHRQISQVDLSDSGVVNVTFKTGPAVYRMRSGEIQTRLVHMKNIREELQKECREPALVDLRYRNLAFVTVAQNGN
ncbi:MAG: cell division protein FtsQ/DivIB [Chitinispirillaceae bacterium]